METVVKHFFEQMGIGFLFSWFPEPWMVIFNLGLLALATFIPLAITLFYCFSMRTEKEDRLERDMSPEQWRENQKFVKEKLDIEFNPINYSGSVFLACLITSFGVSALLFFKPLSAGMIAQGIDGLDFSKGINILTIGPFLKFLGEPGSPEYQVYEFRLFLNLAAFQFGFLGAWIYFILNLIRSYFTCDLRPNTFVNGNIRMIVGSLVALVAAFTFGFPERILGGGELSVNAVYSFVPPACFFFGFFPNQGIFFIKKTVSKKISIEKENFQSTPLSSLPGMSYMHLMRLEQEGFDNMENLKQADPLSLTLRTGFGFKQVSNWIGEAWLRYHLGDDYNDFKNKTGLTNRGELEYFVENWTDATGKKGEEFLVEVFMNSYKEKIIAVIEILKKP